MPDLKVLTIVGKVDTRPLVYPLLRALELTGFTGVITDDGAYRRLFPGTGNLGCVNNVDISICPTIDAESIKSLSSTGISYDNIVVVSSGYIPEETTGMIVCHGINRDMVHVASDTEDEDDDFLIFLEKLKKQQESQEQPSPEKAKGKGKKGAHESKETADLKGSKATEAPANQDSLEVTPQDEGESLKDADSTVNNPQEAESPHDKLLRMQQENPDKIIIPEGMVYSEVQIAYAPLPKKSDLLGILLKDGLVQYCYTCEERQELLMLTGKQANSDIAAIASKPLGIDTKQLYSLLTKEEGASHTKKQK